MMRRRRHTTESQAEESAQRRRRHGSDNNTDTGNVAVQKINIQGSVIESKSEEMSETSRRRRKREVTSKHRRRISYPEVDLEQFKVTNSLSHEMCESCKHKDIRMIQDNFNLLFLTLNEVARELDIDEDDWTKRMKKLRYWAKERQNAKVRQAHKQSLDKDTKRAIKKNGGR